MTEGPSEYYSIGDYGMKIRDLYHFQGVGDKRGMTTGNAKQGDISLSAVVSIWVFRDSDLSNKRPRNFYYQQ
jgi:hypothetical protein